MPLRTTHPLLLALVGLGLGLGHLAGCGAEGADEYYEPPGGYPDAGAGGPECFSSNECPTGWTCSEFGTCQPPAGPPGDGGVGVPEEVEDELGAPVSSLRYVYVPMTEQDALARIDGATLEVRSLRVGEKPRVVAAAPDSDTAVVLDAINGVATIVRPTASADEKTVLATLPNLNQILIDPTGRYAVAWFDLAKAVQEAGGLDAVDQIGSFQDVTVIALPPGQPRAVDLTVGFRPRAVSFDTDGTRAFVVTEDGVSVIDLALVTETGPAIVAPIAVTPDPFADPATVEVQVTPTGTWAVARETGVAALHLVGLPDAMTPSDSVPAIQTIELPAAPTDLDLAPDGARAYAVLRDASALAVITLPPSADEPVAVDLVDLGGAPVGSLTLARGGHRGVLFTNATAEEQLTVIELDQPGHPHRTWPLQKSVRAVHLAPDGETAIVVHARAPGDPDDAATFDEYIDRSHGYSVFDVSRGFAKLQITPVEAGALSFAPDAPRAYVALDGGDQEGAVTSLQIIELDSGVVRPVGLRSPPDSVGVLPGAQVAFVSQRHPLGRISFLTIAGDDMRTITGFDLNSRIID